MQTQPLAKEMMTVLHELIPSSIKYIPSLDHLCADRVFKVLNDAGIEFECVLLPAPCTGDWEFDLNDLEDDEVLELLDMSQAGHEGELLICTEACFIPFSHEPFRCHSSELVQFVHDYDMYSFFHCDVIIVCKASRTLTVYHHSGGYAHVKL